MHFQWAVAHNSLVLHVVERSCGTSVCQSLAKGVETRGIRKTLETNQLINIIGHILPLASHNPVHNSIFVVSFLLLRSTVAPFQLIVRQNLERKHASCVVGNQESMPNHGGFGMSILLGFDGTHFEPAHIIVGTGGGGRFHHADCDTHTVRCFQIVTHITIPLGLWFQFNILFLGSFALLGGGSPKPSHLEGTSRNSSRSWNSKRRHKGISCEGCNQENQ
mmetsp:Transcript_7277/g.12069  ORF Transcript_7277/g.12069 Transcript_7277/m.12069 type:complete len:220 (-) Transcript_7277:140-799(-)